MIRIVVELCLVSAVLTPFVGAAISISGGSDRLKRCRTAAGLGWVSVLLAVITATAVALRGPFGVTLGGTYDRPVVGLWADQLTVTLLVLVCGMGALVQSFSTRYLQADRTSSGFFAVANVVVGTIAIVCTSVTAPVLVSAWVVAGLSFVAVIGVRPDLPGVRTSVRSTLAMFALGDLALVAALIMVTIRAGNVDLVSGGALQAAERQLGGLSNLVALLVVIAALTRSAQGPLGRWLPGTVSAPTPASALLHAGVVNGGGILLVRFGVVAGGSTLAMLVAFTVAGLTAVVATAVMTTKADVKGALVFSTMGQMGFMVAECAVGAYLAAVIHLVGHSMYKATLFFGSGSQVPRTGQAPTTPTIKMSTLKRTIATIATSSVTLGAMLAFPGVLAHRGGVVLLVFTAATTAVAVWSWSDRQPVSARLAAWWTASMFGAGFLYGLILGGLGRWITPALPAVGAGSLSPWWLLAPAVFGLVVAGLIRIQSVRSWLVAVLVYLGTPRVVLSKRGDRSGEKDVWSGLNGLAPKVAGSWVGNPA